MVVTLPLCMSHLYFFNCEIFAGAEDVRLHTVLYWYSFEYIGLPLYKETHCAAVAAPL